MNGHDAAGPPADGALNEEKPVNPDDVQVGVDDPPKPRRKKGPKLTKK